MFRRSLKCWCLHFLPSPIELKCPLALPSHHKKGKSGRAVCHWSLRRAKPTLFLWFACLLRAVAFSQQSWNAFLHSWEPGTFASLFAQENLMGFNFIPSWQHFSRGVFWYLLAAIELKPRMSASYTKISMKVFSVLIPVILSLALVSIATAKLQSGTLRTVHPKNSPQTQEENIGSMAS